MEETKNVHAADVNYQRVSFSEVIARNVREL